jgi:hypothetical protein
LRVPDIPRFGASENHSMIPTMPGSAGVTLLRPDKNSIASA